MSATGILIDTKYPEEFLDQHQDRQREDMYVRIPVSPEMKKVALYWKTESLDPMLTDVMTPTDKVRGPEEFTGLPPVILQAAKNNPDYDIPIKVRDGDSERSLGIGDGFICGYVGRFAGPVWVDRQNNRISHEQAMQMMQDGGRAPRKFHLWAYYLDYLILTDGPIRRERAMESAERQRARSEQRMAEAITRPFAALAKMMGVDQIPVNLADAPNSPEAFKDMLMQAVKSGKISTDDILEVAGVAEISA